jgi:deoxycytidylate deaminase
MGKRLDQFSKGDFMTTKDIVSIEKIRKWFVESLHHITHDAEIHTKCKRKGVGCQLVTISRQGYCALNSVYNGPSRDNFICTNQVGNCGCMHSEPKAIIDALRRGFGGVHFIMLCTYSPCTNCANIILNSGIVKGIVYSVLTEHDKRGDELLRKSIDVLTLNNLQFHPEISDAIIRKWLDAGGEDQ